WHPRGEILVLYDEGDPAIDRLRGGGGIGAQGTTRAIADRGEAIRRDAVLHEIALYGLRPAFRKRLIVLRRAREIGVALDHEMLRGTASLDPFHDNVEHRRSDRIDHRAVLVEDQASQPCLALAGRLTRRGRFSRSRRSGIPAR